MKNMKMAQVATMPAKTKKRPASPIPATAAGVDRDCERAERPSMVATRPTKVERELEGRRTPRRRFDTLLYL